MSQDVRPFDYGFDPGENRDGPTARPAEASWESAPETRTVTVVADRPRLRAELVEDAAAARLRTVAAVCMAELGEGGGEGEDRGEGRAQALGDVILVDVPLPGAVELAALARFATRAARAGAQLVVSTTLEGLDAVFACLDRSSAEILVEPTRAERVIALGCVLGRSSRGRVRELSGEDRIALLRLTEQVAKIAEKLDGLGGGAASREPAEDDEAVARVGAPVLSFSGPQAGAAARPAVRATRPPLPDPRLVRQIVRNRQRRAQFFGSDLFADPAWDILLDLTAARAEHIRVSVTSLCIASGVPPTTALRWIGQMTEAGLLERVEDEIDRRRAFIGLSDRSSAAMAAYFAELGADAARLV